MGRKWVIAAAALMLVLGLGVLLYPTVSSTINRMNGSYVIQEFQQQLNSMDDREKEAKLEAARVYNAQLRTVAESTSEEDAGYHQILDFGNGIMGYIHIPRIDVKLPIYHGVSNQVLEKGVGHLPSSSFPIEGEGNHAVLTGHTGLPSASLFTDLDKMQEGDRFHVTVGGTEITYQVDQIKVVLPNDTAALQAIPGEDYCTLVTCTPYGVNSHRLLVRGARVDMTEEATQVQAETTQTEDHGKTPYWPMLILFPAAAGTFLLKRKKGRT